MVIDLIDPKETIKFIPESEKGKEQPTIIHLKQSDVRDSLRRNKLFKVNMVGGKPVTEYADGDIFYDYIISRIVKIENVSNGTGVTTITDKEEMRNTMDLMPSDVGLELLVKVMETSNLTEDQTKN